MFDLIPFDHSSGNVFDVFDKMMNDSFFGGAERAFAPFRTDIIDEGDKYLLKADMPGFNKNDIQINVEGNQLTIQAERKEEQNENGKGYVRRERRYGALSRSFDIEGLDASKINASYQNGVLEVELPKPVEEKPTSKVIEIK